MKDLTNIPERFHILFETDYNAGVDSEMKSLQRMELNNIFLEYNKWDVKRMIDSQKIIVEETIVGFIKD